MKKSDCSLLLFALFSPVACSAFSVKGNFESLSSNYIATGWVCNADAPTASLKIDFYAAGNNGAGGKINKSEIVADRSSEAAVTNACGGGGGHRFSYRFTQSERSRLGPDTHLVYLKAKYSDKEVVLPGNWLPMTVAGTYQSLLWAPMMSSDCHVTNSDTDKYRYAPSTYPFSSLIKGNNCNTSIDGGNIWKNSWLISGTSEVSSFTTDVQFPTPRPAWGVDGSMYKNPPFFNWDFYPTPAVPSSYTFGLSVDKVNGVPAGEELVYLPKYSGGFFNTPLQAISPEVPEPDLITVDNIFVRFEISRKAHEEYSTPQAGEAKNRITFGVVAIDPVTSRRYFTEVNLWKTPNFDLCVQACDPGSVWDREFGSAVSPEEGKYYDGRAIQKITGKTISPLGLDFTYYLLPISQLFTGVPWKKAPASALLSGTYLGTEVWGKGRTWLEIKGYDLFKFTALP